MIYLSIFSSKILNYTKFECMLIKNFVINQTDRKRLLNFGFGFDKK